MKTFYEALARVHMTEVQFYIEKGDILVFNPAIQKNLSIYRRETLVKTTSHSPMGIKAMVDLRLVAAVPNKQAEPAAISPVAGTTVPQQKEVPPTEKPADPTPVVDEVPSRPSTVAESVEPETEHLPSAEPTPEVETVPEEFADAEQRSVAPEAEEQDSITVAEQGTGDQAVDAQVEKLDLPESSKETKLENPTFEKKPALKGPGKKGKGR